MNGAGALLSGPDSIVNIASTHIFDCHVMSSALYSWATGGAVLAYGPFEMSDSNVTGCTVSGASAWGGCMVFMSAVMMDFGFTGSRYVRCRPARRMLRERARERTSLTTCFLRGSPLLSCMLCVRSLARH